MLLVLEAPLLPAAKLLILLVSLLRCTTDGLHAYDPGWELLENKSSTQPNISATLLHLPEGPQPRPGEGDHPKKSRLEEELERENLKLRQDLVELLGKGEGSTRHHTLDRNTPAVSVMLLGAIAFQMGLFYLVNWPDEDIQYYTYHVLGRAISIFIAVLIFDAVHDICELNFLAEHPPQVIVAVASLAQLLVWFIIMQLVTGQTAGAMPWSSELPELDEVPSAQKADMERRYHRRKLSIKCWSGLLTHITGFAAITSWSNVQQTVFFRQSFWTAILVVPMAFISVLGLYKSADWIRYGVAILGDGEISSSEELWDEESEEAENDVMALCLSFTTVQAIQFSFLGSLPDVKGTFPADMELDLAWGKDCLFLLILAVASAAVTYMSFRLANRLCHENKKNEDMKTRLALIFVNYCSMSFGWYLFYAIKAGLHYFFPNLNTEGLVAKIIVALSVSLVSCPIIFALDFLADSRKSGSEEQRAIAKVIIAKGFLIGFSWEGCFTTAFHCISHNFGGWVSLANLGLSFMLCIVVLPAYRWYILPEMDRRLGVLHDHHKTELVEEKVEINRAATVIKRRALREQFVNKRAGNGETQEFSTDAMERRVGGATSISSI